MIITKKMTITVNPNNINHYKKLGYGDIHCKDIISVNVLDIPKHSKLKIECVCTNCSTTKEITYNDYNKITSYNTTDYFCKDCKSIKTKKTNTDKYGVSNVFQLDIVKEKIKKTNIEKRGVSHHTKTPEYIDKVKITNNIKYGVDFVQQNKDIQLKKEQTSLEKYGHKTSLLNNDVKNKSDKTMLLKYGTTIPLNNTDIKNKYKNTLKENVKHKYDNLSIIDINGNVYIINCDNGCEHSFNITSGLLYHRYNVYNTIICTKCNKINSKSTSGLEIDLYNYIYSIYDGEILTNNRSSIKKELDIYLPDLKLAFEFNGVYWHNELYKHNNYHIDKTNLCDENDIQLLHIWEDDWLYKQQVVKSMIRNKIKNNQHKIFARKCIIKEITDNKLIKQFLNDNHLQGYTTSSIKLGLFYNDELVSLMTFGKKRKVMNSTSYGKEFELIRFCNKINTSVVGGASRLFKKFINTHDTTTIVSYADRSHSNGGLYKQLGFDYISTTTPNYYYVVDGIRKHRFNYRKDKLVKDGYDERKTEHEIMLDRKIYRLYNSGNLKYIYTKKSDN